jgi:O-antigen/teichoic acid export membrane protein
VANQFKSVLLLTVGFTIAQAVSFLSLPLMTRSYNQVAFGGFFLFSTVSWIFAVIATFQLEHAIMLPKSDKHAMLIVEMVMLFSVVVSAIGTLVYPSIDKVFNGDGFGFKSNALAVLLGFTVFGIAATQVLRAWHIRQGNFSCVAIGSVLTAVTMAAVAVLNTKMQIGKIEYGLMYAQTASLLITAFYWIPRGKHHINVFIAKKWKTTYRVLIRKQCKTAGVLTISNLIKTGNGRIMPVIVTAVGGTVAAGDYGLAERVISSPTALLGKAMGSVYRNHVGKGALAVGRERALSAYWKFLCYAFIVGLPIFSTGFFISPKLFHLVFGPKWENAGKIAAILVVGEFFVFILTTVEDATILTNSNRFRLFWQIAQLIAISSILLMVKLRLVNNLSDVVWWFVSAKILFSLIEVLYFYQKK